MDSARELLEAERREATQRLADLTRTLEDVVAASRDSNADDEHDPEGATIAYDRAQVTALGAQAREHIREIDAALERLGGGTYGICEGCGRPIGEARLEARPATRTCIACARGGRA